MHIFSLNPYPRTTPASPAQETPTAPKHQMRIALEWQGQGATDFLSTNEPVALELRETSISNGEDDPTPLKRFRGLFEVGPKDSHVAANLDLVQIGTPGKLASRLLVDRNHNGSYADDPEVKWANLPGNTTTPSLEEGSFDILLGQRSLSFQAYRFPEATAPEHRRLWYSSDYGTRGFLDLTSGKRLAILVIDPGSTGDFTFPRPENLKGIRKRLDWYIDFNHDGKFDENTESRNLGQPIDLDGETFRVKSLSASGEEMILESTDEVPSTPRLGSRPETGTIAPLLEGEIILGSRMGQQVSMNKDFKGKIILVDFWATWCGPCLQKFTQLGKLQQEFGSQGLVILGVSRDVSSKTDRVPTQEKVIRVATQFHCTWEQMHDWSGNLGNDWGIVAIPDYFLIDGDTNTILAAEVGMNGEKLTEIIRSELKKKK